MPRHYVKNRQRARLAAPVGADDTAIPIVPMPDGQTIDLTDYPYWPTIGDEHVEVTDLTNGLLTVVRGANGTTPTAHKAGEFIQVNIIAETIDELHQRITDEVIPTGNADGDLVFWDVAAQQWLPMQPPQYTIVDSGTFTPDYNPDMHNQNVESASGSNGFYQRIGNIVFAGVTVNLQPSASDPNHCDANFELPIGDAKSINPHFTYSHSMEETPGNLLGVAVSVQPFDPPPKDHFMVRIRVQDHVEPAPIFSINFAYELN